MAKARGPVVAPRWRSFARAPCRRFVESMRCREGVPTPRRVQNQSLRREPPTFLICVIRPDNAVGGVVIIDRDVSVAWQLCAQRNRSPLLRDEDTAATLPQAAAPNSLTRVRELLPLAGIGLHADL